MMAENGFLLVDKQVGWTSFDVCGRTRKLLNTKKVGHTGTLDPFATGLLVVAVGKATRMIPFLEKDVKEYEAVVRLGATSETLDPESEMVDTGYTGVEPTQEEIEKVLGEQFMGKIMQVPPKYSALKVNGKRMYALARAGEEIEIPPREAEVLEWEVLEYAYPLLRVRLVVGAGFYVRSFARDVGVALGTGGMCQELRRTGVGSLRIEDAVLVEEVSEKKLIDPKEVVPLPQVEMPPERMQDWNEGRAWTAEGEEGQKVLMLLEGRTVGVGEFCQGTLRPRIVL